MSATTHLFAPEEIMAHLDGELTAAQAQSVSAHIESCAACQELVTSLRNTSHTISNWTVAAPPVNARFVDHLSAAVAKAPSNSHRLKFQILPSQRWKLLGASSVLVVLVILIIGWGAGRYTLTPIAKLALTKQVREQEAIVARLREGDTTKSEAQDRWFLTSPSGPSAPPKPSSKPKSADRQSGAGYKSWLSSGSGGGSGGGSAPSQAALDQKANLLEGPMIARTVTLALLVKDFDSARASLDAILARHNGYAATLGLSTPQGAARSLQASLRIPASELASSLIELRSLGHVETEMQNGEEVTRQHADLVARLKNSRETEQRLQAILVQRTGKISDVLAVEQEIARVRGEIEQMEAEQKNLERRVSFTTIDLSFSEEYKAKLDPATPSISTLIHNAAVNGYRNVTDTLLSIILFFAEYGPVLCFWLLLFSIPAWLVWRRWRHATATT
jgi:Domain of unknown function (DUF4349)/Putative zinc-finger